MKMSSREFANPQLNLRELPLLRQCRGVCTKELMAMGTVGRAAQPWESVQSERETQSPDPGMLMMKGVTEELTGKVGGNVRRSQKNSRGFHAAR